MPKDDFTLEKALPSNVEAERLILGVILLDNAAINQAVERLRPEDFFLPSHRKIFDKMMRLSEQGRAIDPVSLQEELRREGELEQVGGPAYIASLFDGVPRFSNIESYTRIVKDKSLLRKLAAVGHHVMAMAFDDEEEAGVILDKAESMILAIGEDRIRQGFVHIGEVAAKQLEVIEEIAGRAQLITGIPTGFHDIDFLTSGMQRGDLVIIAARPSMGKTAFCLNIAQNAALGQDSSGRVHENRAKAVVGIFSLEMSKEQLVQRLLCSQAQVDAHRLRAGMLNKDDWRRLAQGVGELSEAQIYLDDSPGISVLEMRAKARRLKNERKQLDMLIVDYLQLMSGRGRNESRQQEVSQISRELKLLAKELNVPLIALSQLSRAPETRTGNHRPQLSDLRESGCLAGESLVTLADGERVHIRELVGKSGFKVWALNEATMKLEPAVVSRAFATGVKPVFRLTTRLGREIRATANHKFRAFAGWKRLDELQVGEHLALPRMLPASSAQTMSDAELALLGHLIGDGCTLPRHVIQYTTREIDLAETVAALALKVFGDQVQPRINPEHTWYQVYLTSTRHHTHGVRSAVAEWLSELGVWGLRSYEKHVPDKVFLQPAAAIGLFLRHLWATDGCIWADEKQGKHHPGIYYATSSEVLAHDVQSLLLRLEINAKLLCTKQPGKGRDQFQVVVSGKTDIEKFIDKVGAVGARRTQVLRQVQTFIAATVANANRDVIPALIWPMYVKPAMHSRSITTRQLSAGIETAYSGTSLYKQNVSRARAERIARVVHSEELMRVAQSDVYWDQIAAVEPAGETEVYDLTVAGLHNFIAAHFFVHNSLEQDADVVMFIYREEVYKPETEKEGIAEIIIGKQRNGPVGSVELVFRKSLTRFHDLVRESS